MPGNSSPARGPMRIRLRLDAARDARDRGLLYRTWAAAHRAGLSHAMALAHPIGPPSAPTDAVRMYLAEGTVRGSSIARLTDERTASFETLERALLLLGEETGTLDQSFGWLAQHFDRRHREITRASAKAIYPLVVSLVAAVLLPIPMLVRGELRAYAITAALALAGWFAMAAGLYAALVQRAMRKPELVRARLARGLCTAIEAGVPLDQAVHLGVAAADSPDVTAHVATMTRERIRSQPLARTFAGCPHVPSAFLAALNIAEETGDHRTTIGRLAELYEDGFS